MERQREGRGDGGKRVPLRREAAEVKDQLSGTECLAGLSSLVSSAPTPWMTKRAADKEMLPFLFL